MLLSLNEIRTIVRWTLRESVPGEELALVLNQYIRNPDGLNDEGRRMLTAFVATQDLPGLWIERISSEDPRWTVGEGVDFDLKSFTRARISQGERAGHIAWKSYDRAIIAIDGATRGYKVNYDIVTAMFAASDEKEVLVTGRYRVKEVKKIVEPGTYEPYGYRVPFYVLVEI